MEKKDEKDENKIGLKTRIRSFFAQEFFKNPVVYWLIILSAATNIANWIFLMIFIKPVDGDIILHYNVYFGVDLKGNYHRIYLLPFIGIILFLINFILSFYFYKKKERIAAHLLLMAGFMIQLSLVVASASIILINY